MSILKSTLRWSLNTFLSRAQRRKFGAFILNEATGDNDGDAATNGEHALLRRVLAHPGTTPRIAFDVGANVGDWSRVFLNHAGNSDRVFSFEPSIPTFERLNKNIASDPRVTCVNAALSDRNGETQLHLAGDALGTNSIHRRDFSHEPADPAAGTAANSAETIRLQTGDDFCAQHRIERIEFVKIDTEGHELAVLNGLDTMLSQHRVGLVQFEYGGTWLDAHIQLADAFRFLQSKGYCVAKIFPSGLKYYDRYEQHLDTFQFANFAAVLPESKTMWGIIE